MFKFLVLNPSEKGDEIVKKANIQHERNGFEGVILLDRISGVEKFNVPAYFKKETEEDKGDEDQEDKEDTKDAAGTVGVDKVIELSCGITIGFADPNFSYEGKLDILITSKWPSKIQNLSKDTVSTDFEIDGLITKTKPRYVFSAGEFHEYGPFQFEDGTCCRFISLSKEGQGKWFYAFNFPLVAGDTKPGDLVVNPFIESAKRPFESVEDGKVDGPVKKSRVVLPQDCFFCLSNPKVETHMIITIEKSVYLTVAKGPLTRYNAQIPFSGHGIIIPVEHASLTTSTVEQEIAEVQKKLYAKFKQQYPDFVLIAFDLNLKKNVHYHKQFLPINKKYLQDDSFQKTLAEKSQINNEKYSKNHKLNFEKVGSVDTAQQFIRFEVFEEEVPTSYVSVIEDEEKIIDLQFPRRVLSYIIRSPKRLYWDKCQQPRGKETEECESFKKFWA